MGDTESLGGKLNDSGAVEITGKVMVVAILVLFFVVVCVFLLPLYAKWFWNRRQGNSSNPNGTRRRRRLDFAPGYQAALRRGLDPSVLKTIPVVVFSAKDFKDGLECAVCLSEVSEGEKARLLPKCNHGFHMECIDMWFQSHSTCPLCRDPVSPEGSESTATLESILQVPAQENPNANGHSTEPLNFPTNVLFWGDESQVSTFGNCLEEGHQILNPSQPPASSSSSSSSSSSASSTSLSSNRTNGTLIIDIPRQIQEDEESKSPVPTRLRSLKRLLSRDNRRLSPRSPRDLDVEQQAVRG